MSYLQRWWQDASQESKNDLTRLVKSGQLEIVGGGWVMNDEANSHYFAIIEQVLALTLPWFFFPPSANLSSEKPLTQLPVLVKACLLFNLYPSGRCYGKFECMLLGNNLKDSSILT